MAENIFLGKFLTEQGYFDLKPIDGRGVCGIFRFLYTTGLCYGLDEGGYAGRYCFENLIDAKVALNEWDGIGDPSGDWIKHKGKIEYGNPKNKN